MRTRRVLALSLIAAMLAACGGAHRPDWAPIIAKAPHAYTGPCRTERIKGKWLQPELNHLGTEMPVPTPCANLTGIVGTYISPSPQAGQHFIRIIELYAGGGGAAETNKLWINVERQPAGAWLITWGAKPGVRVEWLLARANANPQYISAGSGRYLWHKPSGAADYPQFGLYANDLDAPTGLPVGITGSPLPHP